MRAIGSKLQSVSLDSLPKKRLAVSTAFLLSGIWISLQSPLEFAPKRQALALPKTMPVVAASLPDSAQVDSPQWQTVIERGDNLSALFKRAGLSSQILHKVMQADAAILALDTLRPGHELKLWKNDRGELTQLELVFSRAHQVVFSLNAANEFSYEEFKREGNWQPRVLAGTIHSSFYVAAKNAGLSASEAVLIESLYRDKIDFSRNIRKGDRFQVLRKAQYLEGVATGEHRIMAVRFFRGNQMLEVFRHSDGHFYDNKAKGLGQGFLTRPFQGNYRISSHFNPRRKHPVTGVTTPHNGTDFATPTGTRLIAPADGVVKTVANHQFAGRYLVIQHGDRYRSRFLHLSKISVSPGQTVRQGQTIARSGATGRVTGAHLHYELHVNGRPVDPMKASFPRSTELDAKQKPEFFELVKSRQLMLDLS
ncbi:peptidoglycan DD-metalloendopeptidase family protein [Paraferrimonas sedimenticola]|uniref:Subfamily M23B unassigned peptidase n=1 Tax=Paraferrimonas sedimenticola TaxID=375674 RepID=A0AA37RVW7_9GAMM|nr:peptidoglycan DD-metalloendopeptidase family protein [Paraferrimonas sedimenticola]GLP95913.1 subfamily M23B unassigned peptidase [Paraferrimonas sedimenticola]